MPIQRAAPPRPFPRAGVQPVLPSWLWKPMPQWLISPSDSKRLARQGKRDLSQERDNPHFLIRFPNTSFPVFFSLGCGSFSWYLKTSLNVLYEEVDFVGRGGVYPWNVRDPEFVVGILHAHFVCFSPLPHIRMYCNYLCTSSFNSDLFELGGIYFLRFSS